MIRGLRRERHSDAGFTLIELMVAMTVFSIMLIGFGLLLSSSLKSYRSSRAHTLAETVGSGEIDKARQVGWANLGTLTGNPPGTLVASEDITVGNNVLHVTRKVELVDDNIPTYGYGTGANYKHVVITITSAALGQPVVYETLVAPPTQPSLYSANVKATVLSTCTGALPGSTVTIANGPSPTRSDTADSLGEVKFGALIPTNTSAPGNYYDVSASATGWQMLPPTNPGDLHFVLDPGNTAQPVMQLYKPATINIHLVDLLDQPVTSPYTLSITDWNGTTAPTLSGQSPTGTLTLSTFGSGSFVPCKSYAFTGSSLGYTTTSPVSTALTIAGYPTTVTTDITVRIPIPARTATTFHLVDNTTSAPVPGVSGVVHDTTNGLEPDRIFTTDATGAATLDLLPDTFTITTTGPAGYFPGTFSYTVPVPPVGQTPTPLDATLQLSPLTYSTFVVTTRDAATTLPVGGVVVTANGGAVGTTTFTTDLVTGQATVTLVRSTYTLTVSGPPAAYQPYSSTFTVTAATTTKDIGLALTGAVALSTKDATTSLSVANAAVTISGGPSPTTTVNTGASGTVATFLLPGTYTVTVNPAPAGYGVYTGTMTVPAGSYAHTVNLQAPLVTFNVTDAVSGSAVGSISLSYTAPAGTVSINAAGTGTTHLPAGTYTVTFAGNATYQPYTGTVTLTGSGADLVAVNLWPKATVAASFKAKKSGSTKSGPWSMTITGPSGAIAVSVANGNSSSGNYTLMPGVYAISLFVAPSGCSALAQTSVTITTGSTYNIACT